MAETQLAEKLTFLQRHRLRDEAAVLAEAVQVGIDALYREALTEAFLLGDISRGQVLDEVGAEALAQIEQQRDALRKDVAWGQKAR
jgi:hypothetical protein